jgi:hypothetical protein
MLVKSGPTQILSNRSGLINLGWDRPVGTAPLQVADDALAGGEGTTIFSELIDRTGVDQLA